MKNAIKTSKKILLTVAMLIAMLGNANEISINGDVEKTALTINNVKEGNLISIKDQNGIILYKELIKASGNYEKNFDLTALPNGNYFFELDKDLEIKTIPFTVESNNVIFKKEEEVVTFKPYVNQKKGLVLVSKLAPNLESLSINIYAQTNTGLKPVYNETIKGERTIERVYKLNKGSYLIVFNSNGRTFEEFIKN
ncbi:hypothetical protein [Flaviramulus aquimarinus]